MLATKLINIHKDCNVVFHYFCRFLFFHIICDIKWEIKTYAFKYSGVYGTGGNTGLAHEDGIAKFVIFYKLFFN